MMLKHTFTTALAGAALTIAAGAAQAQAAEATSAERQCADSRTATEILDRQILDWKGSDFGKALADRDANRQLVLLIGTPQMVNQGPNSAQFGKSLELAFAKSFLETQVQFVKMRSQEISTDTAAEFFNAAPAEAEYSLEEEEKGRLMRLGEKLFTLTEAKLDEALRGAGVSDDEIKKIEPSKKVTTFKDRISRASVTKAFGAVAGVLPVQNFIATDCANGAAVAMVSVFSEKNLDFARDVRNGKSVLADKDQASGKTLSAVVDAEISNKEVLDIYGLRKAYDQSGYPSLVSYGQWSFVSGGATPRNREMKRKAALIQAESNAKAQIANYLNGSAKSVTETMTEETAEEFTKVTRDNREDSSAVEIVEKQLARMSSSAQVKLTGLRTLGTWTLEHPMAPDVIMVGSIVAWSPQFADAINQATGSKKRQAASDPVQADAADRSGQVDVRSSKVKNNAADF